MPTENKRQHLATLAPTVLAISCGSLIFLQIRGLLSLEVRAPAAFISGLSAPVILNFPRGNPEIGRNPGTVHPFACPVETPIHSGELKRKVGVANACHGSWKLRRRYVYDGGAYQGTIPGTKLAQYGRFYMPFPMLPCP